MIAPEHLTAIVTAVDVPEAMLKVCTPDWWRAFLRTLHFTGMRRGEALGLRWTSIDSSKNAIKVLAKTSKSRRTRILPQCDHLMPVLIAWRQCSPSLELVFPLPVNERSGKTKDARVIFYDWERIQLAAGIERADQYDFQDFRSTCATELLEAGWLVPAVKDWLGHAKSSTVLERYYANTIRSLASMGAQRRVV